MCKCCCKIKEIDSKLNKFLTDKANVEDLATIATTGLYSDLLNNPLKTLIDSEDVFYHSPSFLTVGGNGKMNYAVYLVTWSGNQDRKLLPGETVKIYVNDEEFAEGIITCDDVVDQSISLVYYINYLNPIDVPENSWWLRIEHNPTSNDRIVLFIKNLDIIENKPNIKLYTTEYKINSVPYESILGDPLKNKMSLVESTIFEGSRNALLMGPNQSGIPFTLDDHINVKEGQIIKIYLNGEDQGSAEVFVSSFGRFANLLNQTITYSDDTWCFLENNPSGVLSGQLCFPGLDLLNTSPTIKIVLIEYKLDVTVSKAVEYIPEIIIENRTGNIAMCPKPGQYVYVTNTLYGGIILMNDTASATSSNKGLFSPLLKCYIDVVTSLAISIVGKDNSGNTSTIYWEKPLVPDTDHRYIIEITAGVNLSSYYVTYKEFPLT